MVCSSKHVWGKTKGNVASLKTHVTDWLIGHHYELKLRVVLSFPSTLFVFFIMLLFPVGYCSVTPGKCTICLMWRTGNVRGLWVRKWDFSLQTWNFTTWPWKSVLIATLLMWGVRVMRVCVFLVAAEYVSVKIVQLLPLLCLSVNVWQLGMSH